MVQEIIRDLSCFDSDQNKIPNSSNDLANHHHDVLFRHRKEHLFTRRHPVDTRRGVWSKDMANNTYAKEILKAYFFMCLIGACFGLWLQSQLKGYVFWTYSFSQAKTNYYLMFTTWQGWLTWCSIMIIAFFLGLRAWKIAHGR